MDGKVHDADHPPNLPIGGGVTKLKGSQVVMSELFIYTQSVVGFSCFIVSMTKVNKINQAHELLLLEGILDDILIRKTSHTEWRKNFTWLSSKEAHQLRRQLCISLKSVVVLFSIHTIIIIGS